jgi:ParB-like chromosome segregation protein Spo0J
MKKYILVDINRLRTHERTSKRRVNQVQKKIKDLSMVKNPVVADRKTLIVLDGHHRLAALKRLGAKKIPVLVVNYLSKNVRVYLRRKNLLVAIIKQAVINMALDNKNFPEKTTRHLIKNRLKNINIAIKQLR